MKSHKVLGLLLPLLAQTALYAPAAHAKVIRCETAREVEGKIDKTSKLKTFTREFWQSVETRSSNYPEALKKKGMVVGDFHFSNLGIYFDHSIGRARLTVNDVDDSGTHLLVGDLLKFLIYLKTLKQEVVFLDVIEAYHKGLTGQSLEVPKGLRELLDLKSYKFEQERAQYTERRRDAIDESDLKKLTEEQKKTFREIEGLAFFQNLTNVQKWFQINSTGSSAGNERYLFVAVDKRTGADGVLEFKELSCSSTGNALEQDLGVNFRATVQFLNNVTRTREGYSLLGQQKIMEINGKTFLVRTKAPNLINELEIDKMGEKKIQKYAEYYAFYLGFLHAASADASYKDAVSKNKDFIESEIKSLFTNFKKRLVNEN